MLFGKHFEEAEATVLFVEMLTAYTNTGYQPYQFILEVRTQSGQTFRTTVKEHFVLFNHPEVGDVVKVQYDPKSQQVKLDTKGDIRYDAHTKELARKAHYDAILSAPPGTPLPKTPVASPQMDPELLQLAQGELAQQHKLQQELLRSGTAGTATILGVNEMGLSIPPLVVYLVDVQVKPASGGAAFPCSFITWIDPGQRTLVPGNSISVIYDPQNSSRIIIHLS